MLKGSNRDAIALNEIVRQVCVESMKVWRCTTPATAVLWHSIPDPSSFDLHSHSNLSERFGFSLSRPWHHPCSLDFVLEDKRVDGLVPINHD